MPFLISRLNVFLEASNLFTASARSIISSESDGVKSVRLDLNFFEIGSRKWQPEKEKLVGIDFDELGINEIIDTLKNKNTDFDAILRDFGNKNINEDPVIHFYELFLKEYDSIIRKSRGVYYTPQPVVNFIVRSVHEALKNDFDLPLGLADTTTWGEMIKKNPDIKLPEGVSEDEFFVQILDPAIGTGTFLVETIDVIHKTMTEYWKNQGHTDSHIEGLWRKYVPEELLPRLYGFELMMAPYAISHMKIGIKLFETGYRGFAEDKKRVQVYLTNTLEGPIDVSEYLDNLDPAMAEETREANEIKKKNSVTVVIGNPPYSGHSFNASKIRRHIEPGQTYKTFSKKKNRYITKTAGPRGATEEKVTWVGDLIQPYFFVDGEPLGERNPKWLNDDYVKFIRYAQYRLDNAGTGTLGFITNHAYFDNPTFRGMRESILNSFKRIKVLDLHGNAKKKEKCPDGSKDENVFQIQQGVGVIISEKTCDKVQVSHSDLWGQKEHKYNICQSENSFSLADVDLKPSSEMYLFTPQDCTLKKEYNEFIKIQNILKENSVGIVTGQDNNAIVDDLKQAKLHLKKFRVKEEKVKSILYRPFDKKYIIYNSKLVTRMREEIMRHMLAGENLGLAYSRQCSTDWRYVFVSNTIVCFNLTGTAGRYGSCTFSPLYIYPEEGMLDFNSSQWPQGKDGRTPNLDKKWVIGFAELLDLDFISDGKGDLDKTFGPEDLFYYIYAVLHSPEYRERYSEFLKIDFPRIPTTSDKNMFKELCDLGNKLSSLHLMESDKLNSHITSFPVEGSNDVTKVGERKKQLKDVQDGKGKLYINETQYFDNLPVEVWNFQIGGYQVCYKWLYDRKRAKRKLSDEDIQHYHKIVVALNETIKLMTQIDEIINAHGGWPDAFKVGK